MKTEIIPGLWIGNWQSAREASRQGGFHVITVAIDSPFVGHEHFRLIDGPGNNVNIFNAAVDAVVNAVENIRKPVLMHCVSGRSRSAGVLFKAISQLKKIQICEAYDMLCSRHNDTRIHPYISKMLLGL